MNVMRTDPNPRPAALGLPPEARSGGTTADLGLDDRRLWSVLRREAEGRRGLRREAGFTLAELVTVVAIMAILATVTLPVAKFTALRSKESDLRSSLREMRNAIDEYKRYSDNGLLPVDLGTDGYPKELKVLVEGVDLVGQVDKKKKFLRRIPIDPITGKDEWGLRSYQDKSDSNSWGGEDVFDVYSLASGKGLNGVPYRKW